MAIRAGFTSNPDPAVREEYQQLIAAEAELSAELNALRDQPATTRDGHPLPLYAKAGLLTDIATVRDSGAEGIGLYRTEFAFMVRESFPSEDEQYQIYRQMLAALTPRPVVMRTLDIGGDKTLPYFPIEEKNPFLGWRGMRFTLDHPEIFLTQLRAMLRANAAFNNLRILFPMITTVEEVEEALRLLDQAHRELREDGWPAARPPIGVMIEVPSAAWQAAQLARGGLPVGRHQRPDPVSAGGGSRQRPYRRLVRQPASGGAENHCAYHRGRASRRSIGQSYVERWRPTPARRCCCWGWARIA
jgi:phosphotransferase system enzyme I (PtsP)